MYNIQIITKFSDFENLKEQWIKLLDNAIFDSFFSSYEWCNCWWQSFALSDDKLAIIVAEKNGELVAIAPLMIRRIKEYGFNLNVLRFIGVPNADRCDIIIHKDEENVLPELINFIFTKVEGWSQLHLNEIPVESLFVKWLQENYPRVFIEEGSECPYVSWADWESWDEYYKSLSKKTRLELNRKNNTLKKEGKSQYHHLFNPGPDNSVLAMARELERKSAKAQHIVTENLALVGEKHWGFQQMILNNCGKYQVLLSWLVREEKLIAYLYGFIYKKRYYAYNTAYSGEAIKYYPGKLIMNEALRYCKENNIQIFDLLRGATHLKSRWANGCSEQQNVYCLRNQPVNWLYSVVVFKLRPFIKQRILPILKDKK
jgi:CelD/BcsL family acetyltransferase involved in cellulose biosynthesis